MSTSSSSSSSFTSRKAKQAETYDGTQSSLPPCLLSEYNDRREPNVSDEEIVGKKRKATDMPKDEFLSYFDQAMTKILEILINAQLNKTDNQDKLNEMKDKFLKTKAVPRNLYSTNDELAGFQVKETYRRFLTDMTIRSGTLLWKEFVEENFDTFVNNLKLKRRNTTSSSSTAVIVNRTAPPSPSYEVCTVSFNSILRKDIPENVKTIFNEKIKETLTEASNFINDFQVAIMSTMLLFKDHVFEVANNGELKFVQKDGFKTKRAFPDNFKMEADIEFSSSPLSSAALSTDTKILDDIKNLFTETHVNFMKISLFGVNGTTASSKVKHPVLQSLIKAFPESTKNLFQDKNLLPMSVMEVAITNLNTNLSLMWTDKKIINKLLNKLIEVLLKIHLAPVREKQYRTYINNMKKENESTERYKKNNHEDNYFNSPNRNFYRMKIRDEQYRIKKYRSKITAESNNNTSDNSKWFTRIKGCEERIMKNIQDVKRSKKEEKNVVRDDTHGTEVIPTADDDSYDYLEKDDKDASRQRIKQLKGFIKSTLFNRQNDDINPDEIMKLDKHISQHEAEVCSLILEILVQYLPQKQNYNIIGFQLPFVLLANDLLRCAGYSKFTANICPMSSTSLNGLRLNAQSVYDLFCVKRRGDDRYQQVCIFNFDEERISDKNMAVNYKDAIFNSFFDISAITDACKRKKLSFDHNITVLPGCAHARILGIKNKASTATSTNDARSKKIKNNNIPEHAINEQRKKDKTTLNNEIDILKAEEKELDKKLKYNYIQLKEQDFSGKIRTLKSKWHKTREDEESPSVNKQKQNDTIYQSIEDEKLKRNEIYNNIVRCKKDLSATRYEVYIRQKASSSQSRVSQVSSSPSTVLDTSTGGLYKVEDVQLSANDQRNLNRKFTSSGTDNGIVNMTESISLPVDKFRYHLSLYNRYSVLSEEEVRKDPIHPKEPDLSFIPLPKTVTTNSADIDFGGGHFRARKKREKMKRRSKEVLSSEQQLSINSIKNSSDILSLQTTYKTQIQQRDTLRDFYDSKKQAKERRRIELIDKKFREVVCSRERKKLKSGKRKHMLMFIGDRGFGYGSRIKGHRRYGGHWKQKIHSKYTTALITNENKTSQTCVFCFSSVFHPKQQIDHKGKKVLRDIGGSFMCVNPRCVSVNSGKAIQSRDSVSAAAIAISGLSKLLFQETLPCFSTSKTSQYNTGLYNKTVSLWTASGKRAGSGAA